MRPEDLDPTTGDGLPIVIDVVEELGADAYIYGNLEEGPVDKPIIARVDGRRPPMKGETLRFAPKEDHVHLFDAQSGVRL